MSILKTKAAASAVLVALSGVVPLPLIMRAQAATATINATGSFISGVVVTGGQAGNFGTFVATGTTGSIQLTPGGAPSGTNNALVIGGAQQGIFTYTVAVVGSARFSITQGIGTLAGLVPGTVMMDRIILRGAQVDANNTFQFVANGTIQTHMVSATTPALTIGMGSRISWTGGRPVGAFSQTVGLFMAF